MSKNKIQVAIQGIKGAFHETAAVEYFKYNEVEIQPCNTFSLVFNKLQHNEVDFGIVAIENSVAGSLLDNYTQIRNSKTHIIGELFLRIKQNLMALPGQSINDIVEVHSHPIAIMQTREFFKQYPNIKLIESDDTALSAKIIKSQNKLGIGAIASEDAARIYGLQIYAQSIESNKNNFTRFMILSNKTNANRDTSNKASICVSVPHKRGSLSAILSILSYYDINLTKIQSLPIVGQVWHYLFYIDLVFSDYNKYLLALQAIKPLTNLIEILGEYKKAELLGVSDNESLIS